MYFQVSKPLYKKYFSFYSNIIVLYSWKIKRHILKWIKTQNCFKKSLFPLNLYKVRVSRILELVLLWVCRKFLHSQRVAKVIKAIYWFFMKNHLIYKDRHIPFHATISCVLWFLFFFSLKSNIFSHSLSHFP